MVERATIITARGTGLNAPAPSVGVPTIQKVRLSIVDTLIMRVPEVAADNIAARFETTSFTKIEDEPTYRKIDEIRDKLDRNTMAIKSPFVGSLYRHLGMVMKYLL